MAGRCAGTAIGLLSALVVFCSCGGGTSPGGLLLLYALDEAFGTETSTISVENVVGTLYLVEGEEFPLRILHRQLRSDSYGRYYYEEYVTDECDYTSNAPNVAQVVHRGLVVAAGPGRAVISIKFKLPLQKADFCELEVVVTAAGA